MGQSERLVNLKGINTSWLQKRSLSTVSSEVFLFCKALWCQMQGFVFQQGFNEVHCLFSDKDESWLSHSSVILPVHMSNLFLPTLKQTLEGWIWTGCAHRAQSRGAACCHHSCCWDGPWAGNTGWGASGGGNGEHHLLSPLPLIPPSHCHCHLMILSCVSLVPKQIHVFVAPYVHVASLPW